MHNNVKIQEIKKGIVTQRRRPIQQGNVVLPYERPPKVIG